MISRDIARLIVIFDLQFIKKVMLKNTKTGILTVAGSDKIEYIYVQLLSHYDNCAAKHQD